MNKQNSPTGKFGQWVPFLIAVGIALIVVVYYVISGQNSMNLNLRQLESNTQIEKAQPTNKNSVVIKCKNGESYEIVYKSGQTNFQDLVYNKCGQEGEI